jgi:hypothetical protein
MNTEPTNHLPDPTPESGRDEPPKKEKVLHARVPEHLDAEIKERARRLGISVSNLVRNVLTNSFGLVGDIVADSTNIARAASREGVHVVPTVPPIGPPTSVAPARNRVIGWQEVTLSLNAVCERCNAVLMKGSSAGVAVTELPAPRQVACPSCMEELTRGDH